MLHFGLQNPAYWEPKCSILRAKTMGFAKRGLGDGKWGERHKTYKTYMPYKPHKPIWHIRPICHISPIRLIYKPYMTNIPTHAIKAQQPQQFPSPIPRFSSKTILSFLYRSLFFCKKHHTQSFFRRKYFSLPSRPIFDVKSDELRHRKMWQNLQKSPISSNKTQYFRVSQPARFVTEMYNRNYRL